MAEEVPLREEPETPRGTQPAALQSEEQADEEEEKKGSLEIPRTAKEWTRSPQDPAISCHLRRLTCGVNGTSMPVSRHECRTSQ